MLHLSEATRPVRGRRLTWPEETAAVSAGCPEQALGSRSSAAWQAHLSLQRGTCGPSAPPPDLPTPGRPGPTPATAEDLACNPSCPCLRGCMQPQAAREESSARPWQAPDDSMPGQERLGTLHHTTCHGTSPRLLVFLTTETTPVYLRFKGRAFQK